MTEKDELENVFVTAVILAAGEGSRFGTADGTKQNVSVGGIPAAARAALAFEMCKVIDEIILVGRSEELGLLEDYRHRYGLSKVSSVVAGGRNRAESSKIGVSFASDKCSFVAVHDGARCLVTPDIIENTVRDAFKFGAAAAAERVVDTVKKADSDGFIEETVDRELVWLVKTPQVFRLDIYKNSAEAAKRDNVLVTDDCMMAERMGYKIKLTDCGSSNIKLTAREDLALCEYYLSKREKEEAEK